VANVLTFGYDDVASEAYLVDKLKLCFSGQLSILQDVWDNYVFCKMHVWETCTTIGCMNKILNVKKRNKR
jgi:hypothetical protein